MTAMRVYWKHGKETLLVTTFSSLAYESILEKANREHSEGKSSWSSEKLIAGIQRTQDSLIHSDKPNSANGCSGRLMVAYPGLKGIAARSIARMVPSNFMMGHFCTRVSNSGMIREVWVCAFLRMMDSRGNGNPICPSEPETTVAIITNFTQSNAIQGKSFSTSGIITVINPEKPCSLNPTMVGKRGAIPMRLESGVTLFPVTLEIRSNLDELRLPAASLLVIKLGTVMTKAHHMERTTHLFR